MPPLCSTDGHLQATVPGTTLILQSTREQAMLLLRLYVVGDGGGGEGGDGGDSRLASVRCRFEAGISSKYHHRHHRRRGPLNRYRCKTLNLYKPGPRGHNKLHLPTTSYLCHKFAGHIYLVTYSWSTTQSLRDCVKNSQNGSDVSRKDTLLRS